MDQYASALDPLGDYGSGNMSKDGLNDSHLMALKQPHLAQNLTGKLTG
jgi:hypothetical protein